MNESGGLRMSTAYVSCGHTRDDQVRVRVPESLSSPTAAMRRACVKTQPSVKFKIVVGNGVCHEALRGRTRPDTSYAVSRAA